MYSRAKTTTIQSSIDYSATEQENKLMHLFSAKWIKMDTTPWRFMSTFHAHWRAKITYTYTHSSQPFS